MSRSSDQPKGVGMRRALRMSVVLAVVASMVMVGVGSSSAARHHRHHVPRWVKHVRRYPGGISNGVRAYLSHAVVHARATYASAARRGTAAPLAPATGPGPNIQVNTEPVTPKMPQNETAVAYSLDDPE